MTRILFFLRVKMSTEKYRGLWIALVMILSSEFNLVFFFEIPKRVRKNKITAYLVEIFFSRLILFTCICESLFRKVQLFLNKRRHIG